ncbi:MAG: hypothetical protein FJ222_00790 [Lentisphaerae bacterium]|nr:hypothetical protein [Lentisphaerota bacterium]
MTTINETRSRREFIRFCGRLAVLGGAAYYASRLFLRGQVSLPGQSCENQGICSSCRAYSRCGLPQALSRRRAQGGRS